MFFHILKKDWKLLWPMVALVTAIQIGFDWAVFSSGLFGDNAAAAALLRPLTLTWFIGIAALAAAVVYQDPVPGVDQDWLIRPLSRTQLLLAKLAFLALSVSLPMVILNLAHALAMGFPLLPSLNTVLAKDLFVFACFIVPVTALAAATRNMTELIVAGAALVVIFAVSLSASSLLFGADWCPTCNTGMSWLQHLLQHVGVTCGAGAMLALQYYGRRSGVSRALAIAGTGALVFVQIPWNIAFSLEQSLSGRNGAADAISFEVEEGVSDPAAAIGGRAAGAGAGGGAGAAVPGDRRSTQLLLHGRVDQAVQSLRRRARADDSPVMVELPARLAGVPQDGLLLVDRFDVRLFDQNGRVLYRGSNAGASAEVMRPEHPIIDIPGRAYEKSTVAASHLQVDYWLTLMNALAEHKIAALDGELRSADIGFCATMLDRNAIMLRCKTIGHPPFCYSATLYAPDGRHDPEVLKCIPDYRRHVPEFLNVLGFYGADLPLRDRYGIAHYAVDESELASSYVLLKIYRESEHFKRTLAVSR
jgi:hypothetical protein